MIKMNIGKIRDTTKPLKDEKELIDERYRATTCCYHRDRPMTHYIISGIGEYPNYGKCYICKSCADFFDSLSDYEWDRQSIVLSLVSISFSNIIVTSP